MAGCGSGAPIGRTPQLRSRVPVQLAGSTLISVPSTFSVPDQRPFCVIRVRSIIMREPMRRVKRGSSIGNARPVNSTSSARPSVSFSVRRTFFSGSTTVTESGPTKVSIRSMFSGRDMKTEDCLPSRRIETEASMMFSAG